MKLPSIIVALVVLGVACSAEIVTQAPPVSPTATPDLNATVDARIVATLATMPTSVPTSTSTLLHAATSVLSPTAVAEPAATPVATTIPGQVVDTPPFPLLNPRVTGIRFFEGSCELPPDGTVVYTNVFGHRTAKCIYWELNLAFERQPERVGFDINAFYYGPGRQLLGRHTAHGTVEKGWTKSQLMSGQGYPQPGNWETGDYQVELFVYDQLVTSAGFTVIELPLAATARPAATAVPATPIARAEHPNQVRLQTVRDRGYLICASRNDVPGFGYLDTAGNNVGFDIDLCRAVAAAVLGDPEAIEIRLITAAERGPTIQSGQVDLLVRTVTWTTSRDAQWGNFVQIMFYDGQGFMVRKDLEVASALELSDATVCVVQGTTTELNLYDFSKWNNLNITILTFEDTDAVVAAYLDGQCDAFTNDHSQLAAIHSTFDQPSNHIILSETISEEPLGPVVPHGDDQWFNIVKTVMSILIYGEAYSVLSDNVPSTSTGNTAVDRLLGIEGSFGQVSLGLSHTIGQDVLKAVGNYGEIYDRNLGSSGLHLTRAGGRNALWSDAPCSDCPKGGQIYAAPLR